jgi:hypothetical protein
MVSLATPSHVSRGFCVDFTPDIRMKTYISPNPFIISYLIPLTPDSPLRMIREDETLGYCWRT